MRVRDRIGSKERERKKRDFFLANKKRHNKELSYLEAAIFCDHVEHLSIFLIHNFLSYSGMGKLFCLRAGFLDH